MSFSRVARRRLTINVHLNALRDNLSVVRQLCPSSRVFCVVKADAYGHGAIACATALGEVGSDTADGFATVFPFEAEELRTAGIVQPLLVLQGPATLEEVQLLDQISAWPVIHTLDQCRLLESSPHRGPLGVWIKIDTGMGRLGVSMRDYPEVVKQLQQCPNVRVMGLLSHLACADELDNLHTPKQLKAFAAVAQQNVTNTTQSSSFLLSLANSAAILAWPSTAYDWVRPGVMLYGSNPLTTGAATLSLSPVMQVSAPLIALKSMCRGDGIGYGQTYTCPQDMQVGYVAAGYGDGLPRVLNQATVMIDQQRVPVIGRVSMDSIALDMRNVEASVGDLAMLWGPGKPVEEMAAAANTISYELLCAVKGQRHYC